MPDLKLRIIADDQASALLTEVSGRLKASGKAGEEFGRKVAKGSKKVDDSLKKTSAQAKKTSISFSSLKGALIGVFAGATAIAAIRFLEESLRLLSQQEQAVNDLSLAMKNLGVFTEGALQEQTKFASELQKVTIFGDEQIIGLQALLTTFGLYGKELQVTTEATLDLATTLKVDLKAAAILLGKAFIGETSSLSRYGIILDANTPKGEKFAAVLNIINKNFGGAAREQVKTYSGSIQQLGNAFGDLREDLARGLIPATKLFVSLLNKSIAASANLVAKQVEGNTVDEITIAQARQKIKDLNEEIVASAQLGSARALRVKGLSDEIVIQANIIKETQKRVAVQKIESDAAAKAAGDKFKQQKIEADNQAELIANAPKRAEAEQQFNQIVKDLQNERLTLQGEEFEARRNQAIDEAGARELELTALAEQALISQEQLDAAKEELLINTTEKLDEIRKDEVKKDADRIDKRIAKENLASAAMTTIAKERLDAGRKALDDLASFSNSKNRELAEIGKAAAIAKATIDTFTGAQAAFTSLASIPIVGPALGTAAAAAAIAAGLSRVAQIKSTSSFLHGTQRVPGPIGEPVQITAHGGETITTAGSMPGSNRTGGVNAGVTIIQNITNNIQVADLGPDERERMLTQFAQSFRDGGDGARQFASESAEAAIRNEGLST